VQTINRKIDLYGSRLSIPLERTPLASNPRRRCAAVSSFGFGGANAHVILEAAEPALEAPAQYPDGPHTFTLSGKSREALRLSARDWLEWLGSHPGVPVSAICAEHAATRTVFPIQESWPVGSREELAAHLESLTRSGNGSVGDTAVHRANHAMQINAHSSATGRRLDLPGHPFVRQRHWMKHGTSQDVSRAAGMVSENTFLPEAESSHGSPAKQAWGFRVEWVPRPFQRARRIEGGTAPGTHANWIVVGDGRGFGRILAEALRTEKQATFWVSSEPTGVHGVRGYSASEGCDSATYGEILRHIITLAAKVGAENWKVLYLAGLDTGETATATSASIERDQDVHGPGDALRLTRAIVATGRILEMWIVTHRAQFVRAADWHDDAVSISSAQAPLWGLGKTLFLEHPELRGGLVDIDIADGKSAAEKVLWQATAPEGEHAVAFRSGTRYIAQLAPLAAPAPRVPITLRSSGAYVVTGGLGGLGLRCARWLAERGARDILLLGRKGLPPRDAWNSLGENDPGRPAVEAIHAIEAIGAKVEPRAIDVRDSGRLESLFAELRQGGRAPRGVVHAAGVNWFGKIRSLDVADFLDTMKVKVSAAWKLHELTREDDLDCFILFSSVSALWGSVDLSHYTAANHFLDALACHRAGLKLPALALDWGPWAEVGMSAKASESVLLHKLGLRLLPPERAIEAMEQLASVGHSGAVIADIDWQKFRAFIDFSLSPSLFDRVAIPSTPTAGKIARSSSTEATLGATDDPLTALETIVRKALGSVMVVNTEVPLELDQSFNLVGMDSLMAIAFAAELERTLNLTLPITIAYNYPTVRAVRDYLYELLLSEKRIKQLLADPGTPAEEGRDTKEWFLYLPECGAGSRPRIYCFPGAGAGPSSYANWIDAAAPWADMVRVQFPGREELASLPPLRTLKELALALAERMPEELAPFAFHGYSLGALVAFELCRELRRRGRPIPAHLFLTGCGVPTAQENQSLHRLADEPFLDALTEHLGEQPLTDERREIARTLLPILRADIEMLESFEIGGEDPVACPITVCVGEQDPLTPRESVMRWHAMTTGDFTLRRFPGGHNILKTQPLPLISAIRGLWQPDDFRR
jgi:surfactin synthase thioesterase subunit/NAD(P)-dependent dehydrogenase (short-subunit alcohol dehydrogenase family)/acyl carrier protein